MDNINDGDQYINHLQCYVLRDRDIVPVTRAEWILGGPKQVGFTQEGPVNVSTIFLGYAGILFETLVSGGKYDDQQRHCSTYNEAMDQHREMVKLVENEDD